MFFVLHVSLVAPCSTETKFQIAHVSWTTSINSTTNLTGWHIKKWTISLHCLQCVYHTHTENFYNISLVPKTRTILQRILNINSSSSPDPIVGIYVLQEWNHCWAIIYVNYVHRLDVHFFCATLYAAVYENHVTKQKDGLLRCKWRLTPSFFSTANDCRNSSGPIILNLSSSMCVSCCDSTNGLEQTSPMSVYDIDINSTMKRLL